MWCPLSQVAMSSTLENQSHAGAAFDRFPDRFVPCYGKYSPLSSQSPPLTILAGLHPWFIHSLSFQDPLPSPLSHYQSLFPCSTVPSDPHPDLLTLLPALPPPTSASSFLASLELKLLSHPTTMLGEVGLDKAFRLPLPSGRKSSLGTPIAHQLAILEAQVKIAIKLGKNISLHSVRTSEDMVQFLRRTATISGFGGINVCLHSFGGSKESARDIQKRTYRNLRGEDETD
jgi:Tat protein secretion system quality control protein TatD with DNase activity